MRWSSRAPCSRALRRPDHARCRPRVDPPGAPGHAARHCTQRYRPARQEVSGVRSPVRPRVPRPRGDLLRGQDRRHRRGYRPDLPRVGRAHAPARQRAGGPRGGAGRPRVVHHLQHPPPARGLLRGARGGRGPEPDQHPPHAARDRVHPGERRLTGGLLPPGLHAARRGDHPAADDAPAVRGHGGRAWWRRHRRVRGPARRRLRGAAPTAGRRERHRGAVLHERVDGPPQGRRAQPAGALPPRPQRPGRPPLRRGRRGAARRADVPRQRLGRAPLRHADRRAARHAPPVRPRRADAAGRAPPGDAPPGRPGDLHRRPASPRTARASTSRACAS